jgi:8-oxo-dGTP diphosphatase
MTVVLYVAGLLISDSGEHVALIQKQRPDWQRGRLNGIGGHVEPGETPAEAMNREFLEETGANVTTWEPFCTLRGPTWRVEWFKDVGSRELQDMTDEHVSWVAVDDVLSGRAKVIPNVRWLLLLALDKDNVKAVVDDPTR